MCHEKCKFMQKREMRGIDHDCDCISKTHSHFFGIFLTYENRQKSIFSVKKRKWNPGKSALTAHTLLKLCRHVPTHAKIVGFRFLFPTTLSWLLLKLSTLAISKREWAHFLLLLANNASCHFSIEDYVDRFCLSL